MKGGVLACILLGAVSSFALGACGAEEASARRPDVLLVTVDTLRADHVGAYGERGDVATPALDALASEGVLFEQAFAHSPLTLPSHSSILTGTYPTRHGVRDNGRHRLDPSAETLAERLRDEGYRTAAFVGAFPVDARFGLDQGFERYDDDFSGKASRVALAERRAGEVLAAVRDWLGEEPIRPRPRPFFAWVHFFDPHAPYRPPEPYEASYAGEVRYVDAVLGDLMRSVDAGTVVIVTADHGEGLGEHGEKTHSLFVYDSTMRVPLIIRAPGLAPSRVRGQVRSVDLLPTVLELAGIEPCADCDGRSLVPAMRGEPVEAAASYGETYFPLFNLGWSPLLSLRADGWKLIDAPIQELYDLRADPEEKSNLAGLEASAERLAAMSAALSQLSADAPVSGTRHAAADAETAAMLRALGYVSAASSSAPTATAPDLEDPKLRLDVWESVASGIELLGRGEAESAAAALSPAVERDPALVLARTYLGNAYLELGRYGAAAEQGAAVLERSPADYEATLLLGRALARSGRASEARSFLERAAALDASDAHPLVELAQLELALGSAERARALVEEAARKDGASPRVLVLEGKLALLASDVVSAERLFREALASGPLDEEARVQLGNLLLGQRRLEEAEALFEDGLRERPETALFLLGLGNRHALAGNMWEALPLFERAAALRPSSPMVLNSLGLAYLQGPDPERGRALLERSLELSPQQPELVELLKSLPN